MNRMKTYDVPHKGLRNALSQLSLLAGKTDYTDLQEVEALYKLGSDIFNILSLHASDENEVILHELETRCPGATAHDVHDHEELHTVQHKLETMLTELYTQCKSGKDMAAEGAEFYLALSEFHGIYLEHTAEEERVTQPLLWQYFTDEELAEHRKKMMAKNPRESLLIWFRFVLPAQRHAERVGLLSGFRKAAPEAFFSEAMKTIQGVLTPSEFEKLCIDLDKT